ncbi:hypothetical protein B0T14DRAFT_495576 [Immersiella caudata]|uniref:Uncharacterized protein n=1 Tax=Immersiella caudata TaxID=314043 RepID=A0AA39WZ23_9PEZI|nr:hypothetical protein B0T14DRAFT_495576 [Immersiella caudata]
MKQTRFKNSPSTISSRDSPNLATLPLPFDNLTTSLTIENNTILSTVLFNASAAANYTYSSLSIRGNPGLRLQAAAITPRNTSDKLTPIFPWPQQKMASMVFSGKFDNAFFASFVDLWNAKDAKDTKARPAVGERFVLVESTLVREEFNCQGLNGLRRKGVFRGEYSCQGGTVEVENGVARNGMESWLWEFIGFVVWLAWV